METDRMTKYVRGKDPLTGDRMALGVAAGQRSMTIQMHAVAPDDPAAFSRQAVSPEFRITTDNIRIVAAELIAFANEIDADWREADIVELRADRPIVPGAAPTPDRTPPPIVRF